MTPPRPAADARATTSARAGGGPSQPAPPAAHEPGFGAVDAVAGLIAFAVAWAVYLATLAPNVTLGDAGELITAAHALGVPHPPGYPLWTLLAALFDHLNPLSPFPLPTEVVAHAGIARRAFNIAWRVNLMSATFGALAAGTLALLVSRSGALLIGAGARVPGRPGVTPLRMLAAGCGAAAGLVFALSPVPWSQAVIAEVYSLNAFLAVLSMTTLCAWMLDPRRDRFFHATVLTWALGLANHHTLILLIPAGVLLVALVDRRALRDLLLAIGVVAALVSTLAAWSADGPGAARAAIGWAVTLGVATLMGGWLTRGSQAGAPTIGPLPRRAVRLALLALAGLALYAYLPLSARTDPPMNWGYIRSPSAFWHHVTRSQYLSPEWRRPWEVLFAQVFGAVRQLAAQLTWPLVALGALALTWLARPDARARRWIGFTLAALVSTGIGFIAIANPTTDLTTQRAYQVFFIASQAVFCAWIGYGLLALGAFGARRVPPARVSATVVVPVLILAAALPVFLFVRDRAESGQRDHRFGWEFGYRMFAPGEPYPPLERGAVLFAGTDAARFVASYLTACVGVRPDVVVLPQNGLADEQVLRDLRARYGSERARRAFGPLERALGRDRARPEVPLDVPSLQDSSAAVRSAVEALRRQPAAPGEGVTVEPATGRVHVTGPQSVSIFSALMAREVFEHERARRAFYVVESYVIDWMYPYLEPYGTILRLDAAPLPRLTPEQVARDRAYWDALARQRLLGDPGFRHDDDAQRVFSKLRTAHAGLYAWRATASDPAWRQPELAAEAEHAFRQALELCPSNGETAFRFAEFCVRRERYDDALGILESYRKWDPANPQIPGLVEQIGTLARQSARDRDVDQRLARGGMTAAAMKDIIREEARLGRPVRLATALERYLAAYPDDGMAWYDLSVVSTTLGDPERALDALERARHLCGTAQVSAQWLGSDGRAVTERGTLDQVARRDPRLAPLRALPDFERVTR